MSLQPTQLLIQGSHLPATFRGSPDDLFVAMLQRMKIVSPSGTTFFVVSDVEPPNNQGPWLKGGTQWWVWNAESKHYVPLDISASETLLFQFQGSVPATANPPVWLKLVADPSEADPFPAPVSWNVWNGSAWVDFTSLQDRSVTQAKLGYMANFFGTAAGVNNYTLTFEPASTFGYGNGTDLAFACLVKFTSANTGPCTLSVNGGPQAPIKKNVNQELVANELVAGVVHYLVFDGDSFQIQPPIIPPLVHGAPVFFDSAVTIYNGGAIGWTVWNSLLANGVPATATAVILQSSISSGGTISYRKISGAQVHVLATQNQVSQGLYPIVTQTFGGLGFNFMSDGGTANILLMGYIA